MAFACAAPDPSLPLLQALASDLACHANNVGELGYQAIAGSAMLSALLSGCLTIYVALFGYRLLFTKAVDFSEAILAAVRIGLVVTLALQWSSYQAVVYRVITEGPGELASLVLQPEGLSALPASELAARVVSAYEALERGPPAPLSVSASSPGANPPLTPSIAQATGLGSTPALTPGGDMLLLSTVGPFVAVQTIAGVLLALAPIVFVLALFGPFLGLLEGWLRALGAALLGGFILMIVVAFELNFLEGVIAASSVSAPARSDADVLAIGSIFSVVAFIAMAGAALAAGGFSISARRRSTPRDTGSPILTRFAAAERLPEQTWAERQAASPSRAQVIADAVSLRSRREHLRMTSEIGSSAYSASAPRTGASSFIFVSSPHPLGQGLRRSGAQRHLQSAARRNRR